MTPTEITSAGGTVGHTYSDANSTGGMAYHASSTAYGTSDVKSVVDTWVNNKFTDELKKVDGYDVRLITFDEAHSFGYGDEPVDCCGGCGACLNYPKTDAVPDWLWNNNYMYWTMSPYNNSSSIVWCVSSAGSLGYYYRGSSGAVRPVINVSKFAISS